MPRCSLAVDPVDTFDMYIHLTRIVVGDVGVTKTVARPSTVVNWKNWEAHFESILLLEATHYPK